MFMEQELYIALDIEVDIAGDMMFESPPHPFRRWMRHTPSVPPGFLRFFVLKLLKEKPMSGSEIMVAI